MKKLAIIGSNGMLGSDLVFYLSPYFSITQISKENYSEYVNSVFDFIINANGNSKRYWGNENHVEDFIASTVSVYKSIFDFPCSTYIYISSQDVYENHYGPETTKENNEINPKSLPPYGFHKYISELIVKKYKENFLILRPSMILGRNLRKGPFYDIVNKGTLFITPEARLQLITTRAIAEIIETLLKEKILNETLNVGGKSTFAFTNIHKYFNKEIKILKTAETQLYEMSVEKVKQWYPKLKTSEEYLQEFLELS